MNVLELVVIQVVALFTCSGIIRLIHAESFQAPKLISNEDDCALYAAPKCFQPLLQHLNCTAPIPASPLLCPNLFSNLIADSENVCKLADSAINMCVSNQLQQSCNKTNVRHKYYEQWRKPINSVLLKLCDTSSMDIMRKSNQCWSAPVLKCLFETLAIDSVEFLTTEMSSGLCNTIELRAQYCLTSFPFPQHCKTLLQLLKNLTNEFVDNMLCNTQSFVLVTKDGDDAKAQFTSSDENEIDGSGDRTCELEPTVIAACFEPMLYEWRCYFRGEAYNCTFGLKELCLATRDGVDGCAVNLLGYGCENDENHHFFFQWLTSFRSIYHEVCDDSLGSTALSKQQELYFDGMEQCWMKFFRCMENVQSGREVIRLITEELTGQVCREVADNVDYCVLILTFSEEHTCNSMLHKILLMSHAFRTSPSCLSSNSTLVSRKLLSTAPPSLGSISLPLFHKIYQVILINFFTLSLTAFLVMD